MTQLLCLPGLLETPEAALKRAARRGDVAEALRRLKALRRPDVADFSTALGACARRKDLRTAKLLLAELLAQGLEPNVASWTAFLSSQPAEQASRCLEDVSLTLKT